jgi:precorrin-2 dehydrogenase / sirohydrochlorin ferrochelatase
MRYYPIFLDLRGRRCLVVGGGKVGQRKVEALTEAGAKVTVISPDLTPSLRRLAQRRKIVHLSRRYRKGDLKGHFLAYAATSDPSTQRLMAGEASKGDMLLNVVDRPALCRFIAPAIVRRGDLIIAISTSGASPALAKKLREELEQVFGPEYAAALRFLRSLRKKLMIGSFSASERQRILTDLVRSSLVSHLREGKKGKLTRLLRRILGRKRHLSELGIGI